MSPEGYEVKCVPPVAAADFQGSVSVARTSPPTDLGY